jgi:hypothetical protein
MQCPLCLMPVCYALHRTLRRHDDEHSAVQGGKNGKGKVFLCLIKHHVMKTYVEVEVQLHHSLPGQWLERIVSFAPGSRWMESGWAAELIWTLKNKEHPLPMSAIELCQALSSSPYRLRSFANLLCRNVAPRTRCYRPAGRSVHKHGSQNLTS